MVRWKIHRRAPKTMRVTKWLELTKRLADTIRNSDLSESKRMKLARWLDSQIDKQCLLSEDISKAFDWPVEFDASVLTHNSILPEHLYARATESMSQIRAFDYATELEQYVDSYIERTTKNGAEANLKACDQISSAARWITFWISKGFCFETVLYP